MTVLLFIAVLVLLIVGHELGHFFAAKRAKMKVLEFGVGFPPKIFGKKFSEDGTEYTLNWVPFGGFVRIFGEDPKEAGEPGSFSSKHPLAQAGVLFAGPFANIVLAFVLSSAAFMIGAPIVLDALPQGARVSDARVVVGEVVSGSPAEGVGVKAGDRVLSISYDSFEKEIQSPGDIAEAVSASDGPLSLTLLRKGEEMTVSLTPIAGLIPSDPERPGIGVASALIGTVSYPPHVAVWEGLKATGENFIFILVSLGSLIGSAFTLSADVSEITGPVGIASLTGEAARFGLGSLLSFAALLSINLGIINLLPFPALDGGRLLFLGIESVLRRKIPLTMAHAANTLGFALLILLMVAVTVGDVVRLFE